MNCTYTTKFNQLYLYKKGEHFGRKFQKYV